MKQQELLKQQTGAEETNPDNNNSSRWNRVQIPASPFWIVGNTEEGYNITMGKYKITHEVIKQENIDHWCASISNLLDTWEQRMIHGAQCWLSMNQWDVMLTVALCAYTDMKYRQDDKDVKK